MAKKTDTATDGSLLVRDIKMKENLSYQVIKTGKDGRFGTEIIEGGLNKKSALFEAKRHIRAGGVAKVFDKQNKKFIL